MGQYSKVISETISRLSYGFEDQRDLVYSETGMLFYIPPMDDTESEDDLRQCQLYPFREEQLLSMENEELAMPQVSLHIVILMDAFFAAVDNLLQTPFLKKREAPLALIRQFLDSVTSCCGSYPDYYPTQKKFVMDYVNLDTSIDKLMKDRSDTIKTEIACVESLLKESVTEDTGFPAIFALFILYEFNKYGLCIDGLLNHYYHKQFDLFPQFFTTLYFAFQPLPFLQTPVLIQNEQIEINNLATKKIEDVCETIFLSWKEAFLFAFRNMEKYPSIDMFSSLLSDFASIQYIGAWIQKNTIIKSIADTWDEVKTFWKSFYKKDVENEKTGEKIIERGYYAIIATQRGKRVLGKVKFNFEEDEYSARSTDVGKKEFALQSHMYYLLKELNEDREELYWRENNDYEQTTTERNPFLSLKLQDKTPSDSGKVGCPLHIFQFPIKKIEENIGDAYLLYVLEDIGMDYEIELECAMKIEKYMRETRDDDEAYSRLTDIISNLQNTIDHYHKKADELSHRMSSTSYAVYNLFNRDRRYIRYFLDLIHYDSNPDSLLWKISPSVQKDNRLCRVTSTSPEKWAKIWQGFCDVSFPPKSLANTVKELETFSSTCKGNQRSVCRKCFLDLINKEQKT